MGNTPSWPFVCLYLARRCEVRSSVTKSNPSQNSRLSKPLLSAHVLFNLELLGDAQRYYRARGDTTASSILCCRKTALIEPAVVPPHDRRYYRKCGFLYLKVNRAGVGSYFPPHTNFFTAASLHLLSGRRLLQPDSGVPCQICSVGAIPTSISSMASGIVLYIALFL